MSTMKKFAAQMDAKVLEELRQYAKKSERTLSRVLTEAAELYLQQAYVKADFREAADEVMNDHADLLERLAK